MKVHLRTLGCRLNEAELEQWSQRFLDAGHQLSQDANQADLIVLNTCAVTHEASRKSRHVIHRLQRENPNARLVVSGCHATLNPDEVAQTLGVDLVVGNADKHALPAIAMRRLDLPDSPASATEPGEIALYARGRHRAFIKIQDGCRYRCTFCIVTVARGEERSQPIADVLAEIRRFYAQGIQEVVLTGVHVGGYGSDLGGQTDLAALVRTVLEQTEIPRIRLASVEPWDLSDAFLDLFANPRLQPHMHLPLQSGSDSVLRRMARRCKTAEYATLIEKLRARNPDFNVTTDIIVGFPGETEAEWAETLDYLPQIGFGHIHIFPYSARGGTKAATLPDQIDKSIRQSRCQQLAELAAGMKRSALRSLLGKRVDVLWEQSSRDHDTGTTTIAGYTPNYARVRVAVDGETDLSYQITPVVLDRVDPSRPELEGKLIDRSPFVANPR
ncbi:MAG: tRNA (N(6)-L-threonylcarbamoyladenosine(37)-C(2))-methylthiotransferase MtaB [Thiotrichales bacterium]